MIGAFTGTAGVAKTASALPGDSLENMLSLTKAFGTRAIGGPVSAGGLYQVNEQRPELLKVAGKQYLMMGNQSGTVDANTGAGNSAATPGVVLNQTVNFVNNGPVDRRTQAQVGAAAYSAGARLTSRNT